MGSAARRLERRNDAKQTIDRLMRQPDNVVVVHYSCESFYDLPQGNSPRITSIAVRHVGSRQTTSFSIHQVAERRGVDRAELESQYDELEKIMLDEFYAYVREHRNHRWIHWNMRDINYGFPAIAHRYSVLKGTPLQLPEANLFDLAALLIDIYGTRYVSHPRLENLMELNGISKQHFLSGAEEAVAFVAKEYVKLHQSTLRKVDIIHNITVREWDGTLRTRARRKDQFGTTIGGWVEAITDTWVFKLAGGIGIVASIVGLVVALLPRGG